MLMIAESPGNPNLSAVPLDMNLTLKSTLHYLELDCDSAIDAHCLAFDAIHERCFRTMLARVIPRSRHRSVLL